MLPINKNAARKGSGYNISANNVLDFANRFGFTLSSARGSKHTIYEKKLDEPIIFFDGKIERTTDTLYISHGSGKRGEENLKAPEAKDMLRVARALDEIAGNQEAVDYFKELSGIPKKKKERESAAPDSASLVDVPFFSSWALALEDQIKSDIYFKDVNPEDYFEGYLRFVSEDDPTISPEEARRLIEILINLIKEEREYFISKIKISDFLIALNLFGNNSDPEDIAEFIDSNVEDKDFAETIKYLTEKGAISYDEEGLSIIDNALKNVLAYIQNDKLFKLSKWLIQSGLRKESKLLLKIMA